MLFFSVLCATAFAQDRTVSGAVTGTDGLSLPGVNVIVQGTSKGTTTDADGKYTLTLGPSENTLVFSFVGYESMTVDATNRTTVDVVLESDITTLNEVVVVGYGTNVKRT